MTIPAPRQPRPTPPADPAFRAAADSLLADIERDAARRALVERHVQAGRRQGQAALARAQAIGDAIAAGVSPARIFSRASALAAPSVRRPSAARRRPALTSRPVIW